MKFLVAFALAVACAHADVSHIHSADQAAEVQSSFVDVKPDGFKYDFKTSNGIEAQAEGVVQNVNSETPTQVVRGQYSYTDGGVTYTVTYTADENGYHPEGAHLPVAPPVPEAIQRSLEYLRTHANPEDYFRAAPAPGVVPVVKEVVVPAYKPVVASARATVGSFQQNSRKAFGQF